LPLVTLRGDHITVDLFDPVTPDWLFRIQHALASLIGAACTGYLAWCLWLRPERSRARARPPRSFSSSSPGSPTRWPSSWR